MKWKSLPGLPGYEASSEGEIRRLRIGLNGHRPRILKGYVGNCGYRTIQISINKKKSPQLLVHRLIALAFLEPPPSPFHEVAHNDGNRLNNASPNLRWATVKENAADRRIHGRDTIGEAHGMSKLHAADIITIFRLAQSGEKQRDIAKRFGVHQAQIFRILHRRNWTHIILPDDVPRYRPHCLGDTTCAPGALFREAG